MSASHGGLHTLDDGQTNVCFRTGSDMECPSGPPARDSIYHGDFLYSCSSFLPLSSALDYHFAQRGKSRIHKIPFQWRLPSNSIPACYRNVRIKLMLS